MQNEMVELAVTDYTNKYLNSITATKVIKKYYNKLISDFEEKFREILLESHKRILYPGTESFDT